MTSQARIQRALALALLAGSAACASSAPTPAAAPAPAGGAPAAAPAAEAPPRETPPAPLPMRPVAFPGFREATLPNGLRLIVVEKHDVPVASVGLYVQSGDAADPAPRAGLATLAAELLTQGTSKRTARQISSAIEGAGGDIGSGSTADYSYVSASVLRDQLPLAMDLVSDVAQNATFPADELETARKRLLSALQANLASPGYVAQRIFARAIYGEQSPYGVSPTPATYQGITRADLLRFYRDHFRAGNALLVVSGDVDADAVEAAARRWFGGWKGGGVEPIVIPAPPSVDATRIYLVHRPGSVQSNILVGDVTFKPDNPDYFPLQVMNRIVGGGSDARLFQILREEKGWTYGAYARLSRPRDVGYFVASAEVRTPVTDSALVEMLHQLNRVRDEPVSQEELDAAKSFLVGSFPLRIETAGQIAGQVAQTRLLGLPLEDLTRYRERIQAVTREEVQRVARQYVRPGQAVIVVVGDAAQVYDELQGVAPVTVLDVSGKMLRPEEFQVQAAAGGFDASRLQPATLEYQVLLQGNPFGTSTTTLRRDGEAWVATQTMQGGPIKQDVEVRFTSDFTPVSAKQTAVQGPVQMDVTLRYADGKVTGSAKLPAELGGERTIDTPVAAGTLLNGMDSWALALADLAPGKTLSLPIFNVQSGGVVNAAFEVKGAEQVTVPAGTFPAYRIESAVGPQTMTVYVRQAAPHLVLKQESEVPPLSVVLQSMK